MTAKDLETMPCPVRDWSPRESRHPKTSLSGGLKPVLVSSWPCLTDSLGHPNTRFLTREPVFTMRQKSRTAVAALALTATVLAGGCGGPSSPGDTNADVSDPLDESATTQSASPRSGNAIDTTTEEPPVQEPQPRAPATPPAAIPSDTQRPDADASPSESDQSPDTSPSLDPSQGLMGYPIPEDWAAANGGEAVPAFEQCPDGVNCLATELPEFYDADRQGDYDASLADFIGPNGGPDGVWDANYVIVNGIVAWWRDLDQDGLTDQIAADLSHNGQGPVDTWINDADENKVFDEVLIDWNQFPPGAQQESTLPAPGPGEVYLRPNPNGGTDIIFGGIAPLPPGSEVENWAKTNSCADYVWTMPDNMVCVPH